MSDKGSESNPARRSEILHSETKEIKRPSLLKFGGSTILLVPSTAPPLGADVTETIALQRAAYLCDGKKSAFIRPGAEQNVGRLPRNDWVTSSQNSSREHARIFISDGLLLDQKLKVEDKGSLNGTEILDIDKLTPLPIKISPGEEGLFDLGYDKATIEIGGTKILSATKDGGAIRQFVSEVSPEEPVNCTREPIFRKITVGKDYALETKARDPNPLQAELIVFEGNIVWVVNTSAKQDIKISAIPKEKPKPAPVEVEITSKDIKDRVLRAANKRIGLDREIKKINELFKMGLIDIQRDNLHFILPKGKEFLDQLPELYGIMEYLDSVLGPHVPPATPYQDASIILLPGNEYVQRDSASRDDIVVTLNDKWTSGTFAHEYSHLRLMQGLGISKTDMLVEGAAVYLGSKAVPKSNQIGHCAGVSDVRNLINQDKEIGLSHTGLIADAGLGRQLSKPEYEYAYGLGTYLTDYIIARFGIGNYFKIYKQTCRDNLTNPVDGKPLISGGRRVGRQRDILATALRTIAIENNDPDLEPERVKIGLQEHLKNGKFRKGILNKLVGFVLGSV